MHFVRFKTFADFIKQGDGQFAAEVLAKFFEAVEHEQRILRVHMEQFAGEEFEAERFQQLQDALGGRGIDEAHQARVNDIKRDAHGNSFAVADLELGKLLEFVRGPMAEVERARGAEFKRVAGGRNVIKMQFGTAANQAAHGGGIEFPESLGIAFERFKKFLVADEGHFDRLDVSGAFVAGRERREQLKIVDDRERRREGADEILFAERIDAILHADAGIRLAQRRGRDAHVPDAAMRRGRGEADHVQQCAAADGDDVGLPIDVMAIDMRMDFGDMKIRILGAFTAFDDERAAHEFHRVRVSGEIFLDLAREHRLGLRHGFIKDQQDLFHLAGPIGQRLLEREIRSFENMIGKEHPQVIADLNLFSHGGHGFKITVQGPKSNVHGWLMEARKTPNAEAGKHLGRHLTPATPRKIIEFAVPAPF